MSEKFVCDEKLMLKYWNDGWSMGQLAEKFDCSRPTVKKILSNCGVTNFLINSSGNKGHEKRILDNWTYVCNDLKSGMSVVEVIGKYSFPVKVFLQVAESQGMKLEDDYVCNLKNLRSSGKSVKEIGMLLGKSESTVGSELKRYGLTSLVDRLDISDDVILNDYNSGMSINSIALKYHCSHDTVTKRLSKYNLSNTRAEGIKRHFRLDYEERWLAIKVDLDSGLSFSAVREKHHIRVENLRLLMEKHGYRVNNDVLYSDLLSMLTVSDGVKREYLLAIKLYIDTYHGLPNDYALSELMSRNVNVVRRAVRRYGLSKFVIHQGISSWVSFLIKYLEDNGVSYEMNNRKILWDESSGHHKELDFYFRDRNIGIEVNPYGTHSVNTKWSKYDIYYHQSKSLLAERCGVGLIHMYDADFVDSVRFKKIMDMIFIDEKLRCGARSCELKSVSRQDANLFLERYHLQDGEYQSKYRYGLYYRNELSCLITFGRPRYTNHSFEIIRYCVRPDFIVIGGFQKLFSYFLNNFCSVGDDIVTYMDLNCRFSVENIYEKCGFVLDGVTQPDYVWVNKYGTQTLKRYDTTKAKLIAQGFDGNKTEKEIMMERGYYQVYRAGSKRFVYKV